MFFFFLPTLAYHAPCSNDPLGNLGEVYPVLPKNILEHGHDHAQHEHDHLDGGAQNDDGVGHGVHQAPALFVLSGEELPKFIHYLR